MGGTKCRPSISPRQILSARRGEPRLAVGQDEVRAKDFLGSNLFFQKVAIPCDFDEERTAMQTLFLLGIPTDWRAIL
ncbi:MAG: hypothetical protein COV00_00365 [Candidatus Tagabacteria bacterium CG10_big_fil_rev_8_21_14_0_10_40_13]|uniref:Uncharacterized protein n=1 Tax=Candidatus Tagabacteria bacterium CG10_big_fil_rev_8_21_14_0_10_40_13 TaxID=1975022 RepID=A0A2M8L9P4_9BACT|nr:MAG: hypothetical protein COV00_00365 [Candidatus Tagabacteria bacterium CG10_big_fil_rev_8_21_14_0_10_40_13]